VIHLGAAWAGLRLPAEVFDPDGAWFRTRGWEAEGRFYDRVFRVKAWKNALPDGAALFRGGFRKKTIASRRAAYLSRYVRETCRGEAVHAAVIFCAPVFLIWNPPGVWVWLAVYALAANLPCLVVQRYNRIRLRAILARSPAAA
jgi:glycosyl-4,4'-diaponeurosporenoate acyltransferase